jgi:hypothetical protein
VDTLVLNPNVRWCESADGIIILDLASGAVHSIHPRAHALWGKIVSVTALSRLFELAEYTSFIQRLIDIGVVRRGQCSARGGTPSLPLKLRSAMHALRVAPFNVLRFKHGKIVTTFALFVSLDLVLRVWGFGRLHQIVSAIDVRRGPSRVGSIRAARHLVDTLCRWYPVTARCLLRSAVLTILLREEGVPADLVICVQKAPLMMHACVEVYSRVVSEENLNREILLELYRMTGERADETQPRLKTA